MNAEFKKPHHLRSLWLANQLNNLRHELRLYGYMQKTITVAIVLGIGLINLVAADANENQNSSTNAVMPSVPLLEKPPFYATPLDLNLTAHATDCIPTTPTPNNPEGGSPGYTRNGGKKLHAGIDLPLPTYLPPTEIPVFYTGTMPGKVTVSKAAFDTNGNYLGEQVVIEIRTPTATYTSRTLHHSKRLVYTNQIVYPGNRIALGGGVGYQFSRPGAGAPHVHWEVRRNGRLIDPRDGRELFNPWLVRAPGNLRIVP